MRALIRKAIDESKKTNKLILSHSNITNEEFIEIVNSVDKVNLTHVDFRGNQITSIDAIAQLVNLTHVYFGGNQLGNYISDSVSYIDGIVAFVNRVKAKDLCWEVTMLGGKKAFIVSDKAGKFAHGETIKKAKNDLLYKLSGNESKEGYRHLTKDSELTVAELYEAYRVITGACELGSKNFIEQIGLKMTDRLTVGRACDITKDAYKGSVFSSFFKG